MHELRLQPKLFNTITGRARPGVRNSLVRALVLASMVEERGFRGRDSTSGEIGGAPLCRRWQFRAGAGSSVQARTVPCRRAHKIGTLESVYVDTGTDEPAFGTVTVGLPTRHRLVFIPLAGPTVGPDYLKVPIPRAW